MVCPQKTNNVFFMYIILAAFIMHLTLQVAPTVIQDSSTTISYLSLDSSFNSFIVAQAQDPIPTTISCSFSESTISLGQTVYIRSKIDPDGNANANYNPFIVYFEYSADGGNTWNIIDEYLLDHRNTFTEVWIPDKIGSYLIRVYWNGNKDYQGAESVHRSLEVVKIVCTISCDTNPSSINLGSSTLISGLLNPNIANAKITLSYRISGGTWTDILTISTNSASYYEYDWTPTTIGTYEVKASWGGDETHNEADNCNTVIVNEPVAPTSSSISCSANPSSIKVGSSTTISGSISPTIADAEVTISYRASGGSWNNIDTITTTSSGTYFYDWTPSTTGTFEVKVNWSGNEKYQGAENSITIEVAPEKTTEKPTETPTTTPELEEEDDSLFNEINRWIIDKILYIIFTIITIIIAYMQLRKSTKQKEQEKSISPEEKKSFEEPKKN